MSASASIIMRTAAVAFALLATLLAALLAPWPVTLARDVDWQAAAARRDKEATGLFATILKDVVADKSSPFETCEIEAEWDTCAIDYAIAHEAIGLEIHASLANPRLIGATSVILGTAVSKDTICDKAARERYRASRIAAWETASKALPGGSTPPEKPFFTDTFFSYPLFDRDFRRAVLVYGRQDHGPRLDDEGKPLGLIKGFGSALVYARNGGLWHKVDRIYLYGSF